MANQSRDACINGAMIGSGLYMLLALILTSDSVLEVLVTGFLSFYIVFLLSIWITR